MKVLRIRNHYLHNRHELFCVLFEYQKLPHKTIAGIMKLAVKMNNWLN